MHDLFSYRWTFTNTQSHLGECERIRGVWESRVCKERCQSSQGSNSHSSVQNRRPKCDHQTVAALLEILVTVFV